MDINKHKKIIDYILDCDYDTKRSEINILLQSVFMDNKELYNTYLEELKNTDEEL